MKVNAMLAALSSQLPTEQQRLLHADFLANERAYLAMRDDLLSSHPGKWVAVHDRGLVASGDDFRLVMEQAAGVEGHPFIAKVGAEEETLFRIRRQEFVYDSSYQPFALPKITVAFWNHAENRSATLSEVIADTGADVSLLPDVDCLGFDLYSSPYFIAQSVAA